MNKIIAAFAAALCISMAVTAYSDKVHTDLQNNLIRLHIIANSDSGEDQRIKLKVRDSILAEVGQEMSEGASRADVAKNINNIESIAKNTLAENGFDYDAQAEYGKFSFPRKSYKSITLPAGEYFGVRVVLGSGGGHNWWCVMYPPLCFTETVNGELSEEGSELLKKNLDSDTYDIISGGKDVVIRFKIVELVQRLSAANEYRQ